MESGVADIIKKFSSFQFLQYVITGGTAFVIDFSLLYILTDVLHVYYLLSASIAYLCGFFWCFELNRRWTFDDASQRFLALGRFTAVAAINYVLTIALLYFFVQNLYWHYLSAKMVVVGITVVWTFFLYRKFVYAQSPQ